jgi:hypothetical protein
MAIHPFDSRTRDRLAQIPLDKILLGIGISYFGLVIFWISPHSIWRESVQSKAALRSRVASPGDREFIAYLQQSLKTLDRNQVEQAHSRSQPPSQSPSQPIPPLSIASSPSLANGLPPAKMPPMATRLIPNSSSSLSSGVSSSPAIAPLQPPQPLTRILLPPPPPKVAQIPATPSTPANVPTLSAPAQSLPTAAPSSSLAPSSLPASFNHSLVGLLESGDQSTVLVSFNGITRRFAIGETLGSSGWQLVAVSNQRAMISRSGKTRYLEVGQGF